MELLITKTTLLTGTLQILRRPALLFLVNSEFLTFRKSNMLILLSQFDAHRVVFHLLN
ncbi:hypothetical protein HanXRQr2_Chr04g0160361 [Helianthus annuus]|uniref:Uncharacterized protein n=1 Tax=Helianthus annuus TaxID=4232 RepID=A0A9K3J6N5_HELAN|nr:hypothetical protein HanXRQr2_Chr04g0160361 [Helianthus annuus]KAJ0930864.1 hypothetical protein HanPSC8_Chr04g0154471 [Helianthus annuus]